MTALGRGKRRGRSGHSTICSSCDHCCSEARRFSRRNFSNFFLENLPLVCDALTSPFVTIARTNVLLASISTQNRKKFSQSLGPGCRGNAASHKAFPGIPAWNNFCTTRDAVIHSPLDRTISSRFEFVGREEIFRELFHTTKYFVLVCRLISYRNFLLSR